MHPLKKSDEEFIGLKYIKQEEKRIELVNRLQECRRKFEMAEVKKQPGICLKESKSCKKIGKLASCHIKLLKGNIRGLSRGLGKEVVSSEERKAVATTAGELKSMIVRLRNNFAVRECRKELLSSTSKRLFTKSLGASYYSGNKLGNPAVSKKAREPLSSTAKLKESVKVCQRKNKQDRVISEWQRAQSRVKRKKSQLFEIEAERRSDQRNFLMRKEKYRQAKLLQKIMKEDEKIDKLRNQRENISRLRQEMRKNASYSKYKVREELEKIAMKHDKQGKADHKLVNRMLETAGLGQVWQLINGIKLKQQTM